MSGNEVDGLRSSIGGQLDHRETDLLVGVLTALDEQARAVAPGAVVGVYLKGSFALGAGDLHADVDFLVAIRQPLQPDEERAVRQLHRTFPDRSEHWAQVLEGSWATVDELRARAEPSTPWLYVDNGQREMEWSTHDNTEVFRWVLRNRALTVSGPAPATLVDDVPPQALRAEAAVVAGERRRAALADPGYLANAWGQPHEVLTSCRMLYTASTARVSGKAEAARWCLDVVPGEWHDLIEAAVRDRPDPWERVHRRADPARAARTAPFVELLAGLVVAAAGQPAEDVETDAGQAG